MILQKIMKKFVSITIVLILIILSITCSPSGNKQNIGLGDWKPSKTLPITVYDHATAIYNNYIYVSGGRASIEADTGLNSIYYTFINKDGKLANWRPTTFMPINVYGHTCVIQNGNLFIIGGNNNTTVYYAPIHADGHIGKWKVHSTMFYDNDRKERLEHTSDIYKERIFITGGHFSQPEIGVIIDDKEIGSGDEYNFGDVAIGEEENITFTIKNTGAKELRIYGISLFTSYTGEFDLGNHLSAVGPFSSMDVDITFSPDDELPKSANIKIDNNDSNENPYNFIISGNTSNKKKGILTNGKSTIPDDAPFGTLNDVLVGPDWKKTIDFPTERSSHAVTISDEGFIYIVGGKHYDGEDWESLNDVRYGSITLTGEVLSWSFTHNLTLSGISGHSLLLENDTLLVIGGIDSEGNVLRSVFHTELYEDGSSDTWKRFVSTLPQPVYDHTSVSYKGFIYVIGGRKNSEVLNTVYYNEIK
jgi:N-acetylneuraminic acid mutarotase